MSSLYRFEMYAKYEYIYCIYEYTTTHACTSPSSANARATNRHHNMYIIYTQIVVI